MGPRVAIWVPGWLYGPGIYHGLGPGNTRWVYRVVHPHYPGYTTPPTHRTRCTGQYPAEPEVNANAFLSKLLLVDHQLTVTRLHHVSGPPSCLMSSVLESQNVPSFLIDM